MRDGIEGGRDALAGVKLLRTSSQASAYAFPSCGRYAFPSATNRRSCGGPGLGVGTFDVSTHLEAATVRATPARLETKTVTTAWRPGMYGNNRLKNIRGARQVKRGNDHVVRRLPKWNALTQSVIALTQSANLLSGTRRQSGRAEKPPPPFFACFLFGLDRYRRGSRLRFGGRVGKR